jgi:Spy/CpxP family protein refolding chaperone
MRKVLLTLAALAAFCIVLPVAATSSANAETVIIKKHRDHGWHHGWRHRDRVVIKERHRSHGVVVREGRRHHGVGVVVR